MKKVGKQVLFLETNDICPRNGEGSFIRLKNGAILTVYTEYVGNDWQDHCNAHLTSYTSYDEGESWVDKQIVVEKPDDRENVMSTSLLRMNNGDIGLFYIQKVMFGDVLCDELLLCRSSDEGKTWSEPKVCIKPDSYRVLNNDRAVMLANGRIAMPIANHGTYKPASGILAPSSISIFYSDDDGESWQESESIAPLFPNDPAGLQEPGIFLRDDGVVWMWSRTALGFQYETFSKDNGETWSPIRPNFYFSSPASPMQVKKVGKYTVSVFNPVANSTLPFKKDGPYWKVWGRTPYVVAVSVDGGKTFTKQFYLEDDTDCDYCYPAIIEGEDYFLVSYYHSNGTKVALNSMKIVKVMFSELEG